MNPRLAAKNKVTHANALVTREKVFELRLAGLNFRQIAEQVGVSHVACQRHFKRAIQERQDRLDEVRDKYVVLELERLDKIIVANWADKGKPQHAAIILRCMDTQARLLGLNAPTKVEHSGQVEHTLEDAEKRRQRILAETADAVSAMTADELTAAAADLLGE